MSGKRWPANQLCRRPLSPPQLIDSQITRVHAATENTHYLAKALAKQVHNFQLAFQVRVSLEAEVGRLHSFLHLLAGFGSGAQYLHPA